MVEIFNFLLPEIREQSELIRKKLKFKNFAKDEKSNTIAVTEEEGGGDLISGAGGGGTSLLSLQKNGNFNREEQLRAVERLKQCT